MTALRGRVAALERRRERQNDGMRGYIPEVVVGLRRLKRCRLLGERYRDALERFLAILGPEREAIANGNGARSRADVLHAVLQAMTPTERVEIARRRECVEWAEAFRRWRDAYEEEIRHQEEWRKTRASGET